MMVSSPELFLEAKKYLNGHQDNLVNDVEIILKRLQIKDTISDFSFLVSPIAKAYEGFLKDLFLKIGIITENDYSSDRFRVGKTLNPSLRYKRFSVYQKLSDFDEKGEELAELFGTLGNLVVTKYFTTFQIIIETYQKTKPKKELIFYSELSLKPELSWIKIKNFNFLVYN